MNKDNFIIGGGPAGLIAAFYMEDYKVIDEKPLGQLKAPFIPGPRLLQFTPNMWSFVSEVMDAAGINPEMIVEQAKIGYNQGHSYTPLPDINYRKKYSEITRGKTNSEDSHLSEGKNIIEHIILPEHGENTYKFVFETLLGIIEQRGQLLRCKVSALDLGKNAISLQHPGNQQVIKYNHIINTINLNIFKKLTDCDITGLETLPKCFYQCKYDNLSDKMLKMRYSYVYSISGEYTRKTYFKNYIVYETIEPIEGETVNGNEIISKVENLPIQIKESKNIKEIDGISMLGRFAMWSHKIKANEVVDIVVKLKEEIYA
tara:strand:- start:1344 stop:2291 length:948 start_codon:yes stop_codon:yes gene_type:complete